MSALCLIFAPICCRSTNNARVQEYQDIVNASGKGEPKYPNGTSLPLGPEYHDTGYIRIYIVLVLLFVLTNAVSAAAFSVIIAKAAQRLHDLMFERLLHVVTKFFDMHPSGWNNYIVLKMIALI